MFFMQQWDIKTNVPENIGINFLKSGGTRQMFPAHNQPIWVLFMQGPMGSSSVSDCATSDSYPDIMKLHLHHLNTNTSMRY